MGKKSHLYFEGSDITCCLCQGETVDRYYVCCLRGICLNCLELMRGTLGGVEECTCLFPGRKLKSFSTDLVPSEKNNYQEIQKFQKYRDDMRDRIWLLPMKRNVWINREFRKQEFYLDVYQRYLNYMISGRSVDYLPSYHFSPPGRDLRTVHGVAIVSSDVDLKVPGYHCVLGLALDTKDELLYSLLRPDKHLLSHQLDLSIKCYYLLPSAFDLVEEVNLWRRLIARGAVISSESVNQILRDGIVLKNELHEGRWRINV